MKKYLIAAAALAATTAIGFSAHAAELKSKAMTDRQLDQIVAGMTLWLNKQGNFAVTTDGYTPGRNSKNGFSSPIVNNGSDADCTVSGGTCTFTLGSDVTVKNGTTYTSGSVLTFSYVDTDPTDAIHMDWVLQP